MHLPNPLWAICKAGTQDSDPCIAMRIPDEVWKLVAANMSAVDWARVSCTSRALSRVRASVLQIIILKTRITTKESCLAVLLIGTKASKPH